MRIGIILLFVCAQVSANSYSQKVTLKVTKVPLTQVFNTIKAQTGYSFFWDQQLLDKAPLITVAVKDASIGETLNSCLKGLSLSYEIKGMIVLIKENKAKAGMAIQESFTPPPPAATYTISGVVTDENNKPMQAVTLRLSPLNMTTVTNAKGEYRFANVPASHYTLELSYIGYTTTEKHFIVDNRSVGMDVKMFPAANEQEELVVSTGYQKLKKATATGSYSVITSKEIAETPSTNLMERLEGKVPGVQFDVRNNKIRMRGITGLNINATDPLIVIDGFPSLDNKLTTIRDGNITYNPTNALEPSTTGNPILSTFNPDDIESITFLKDAAAAAIWGSRAANGVIVIETKKGKRGEPSLRLNTTVSVSAPPNMSSMDVMSGTDYINLEKELVEKNFVYDATTYWRYAAVSEAQDWIFKQKRGAITATQLDSALAVLAGRSNQQQIKDYLLQKIVTQQYNLSLSGGGDHNTYNISGNYTKNRPVFKSNQSESYFITANLNNDFLNKRITVGTILNYTYSKNVINSAAVSAISAGRLGLNPYDMLVDANGNPIRRGLTYTNRVSDSLTKLGHLSWLYSPVDELNYNNTIYSKNAFRANVSITGQITNWLNLQVSGQLQRSIDDQKNLQNLNSLATREKLNNATYLSGGTAINGIPVGGIYKMGSTQMDDYGLRAQLNFNKTFNGIHQVSVIAGSEIRESKATGFTETKYGYDEETSSAQVVNPSTKYKTFPYGTETQLSLSEEPLYKSRTRYLSYYSTANYSLWNKYFLSGSVRFDDGTMVGVERSKRALPLWSTGLRWDMKQEKFLSHVNWLNMLSTRFTFGKAGTLPVGGNNVNIVTIGLRDGYTQLPYTTLGTPANDALGWSTTQTLNFGVDAAFLSNRLAVGVDVFKKKTYDLVLSVPFNATYGITTLAYNTADMTGKGIEVNLTGQIIRTKDWQWTSNFNFSYNTSKVTDDRFPNVNSPSSNIARTGYPIDNMFVYRWAGLNNKGQSQIYNAKGAILTDVNYPTINIEDLVYAGRTTPPYFGGFSNTFQYKNLSLLVRATYAMGHKFLRQDLNNYPSSGGLSGLIGTSKALARRWRKAGDEANTDVPGLSSTMNTYTVNFYKSSDRSVLDAGQVRLQQISLGYTLPQSVIGKIGVFKSAAVNATVSNLGIIWRANKEGIDPDYVMTGSYNNLPPSVNYTLNINLTF